MKATSTNASMAASLAPLGRRPLIGLMVRMNALVPVDMEGLRTSAMSLGWGDGRNLYFGVGI